jgi:hypothetical protein
MGVGTLTLEAVQWPTMTASTQSGTAQDPGWCRVMFCWRRDRGVGPRRRVLLDIDDIRDLRDWLDDPDVPDPDAIRSESAGKIGAWNDAGRALSERFLEISRAASRTPT